MLVDLARATAGDPMGLVCEAVGFDPTDEGDRAAVALLLGRGHLVVCFDGFDEMTTRRSFADVTRELQALFSVAGTRGRVVVSSRDQYIVGDKQMADVLHDAASGAGVSGTCRIALRDFDAEQVATLVRQVVEGADAQRAVLDKIHNTYDLQDLVRTPLLLRMVLETIDQIDPNARVGSATIYEQYLERWLDNSE